MSFKILDEREPFTFLIAWDTYTATDNSNHHLAAKEIAERLTKLDSQPRNFKVVLTTTDDLSYHVRDCISKKYCYACFIVNFKPQMNDVEITIKLKDIDQHPIMLKAPTLNVLKTDPDFNQLIYALHNAAITGHMAAKFKL